MGYRYRQHHQRSSTSRSLRSTTAACFTCFMITGQIRNFGRTDWTLARSQKRLIPAEFEVSTRFRCLSLVSRFSAGFVLQLHVTMRRMMTEMPAHFGNTTLKLEDPCPFASQFLAHQSGGHLVPIRARPDRCGCGFKQAVIAQAVCQRPGYRNPVVLTPTQLTSPLSVLRVSISMVTAPVRTKISQAGVVQDYRSVDVVVVTGDPCFTRAG